MKHKATAYIAMSIAMITVGSSFIVGKWIVESFPIYLASALRYGMASILLVLLLYWKEGFNKIKLKDSIRLLLQSLTGVFGFSVSLLYGLKYTTAMESGVLMSTTPMVIALISFVFLRERLSRLQWISVLLTVFGISVIHLLSSEEHELVPGVPTWVGNLLIFGAVIGEALFTIFGKVLSDRLSALTIATYVTVFGFGLFLPFAAYEAISFDFTQPTIADWMYIVYYAVVVTVIGFILWYFGVSKVATSTSAVFTGVIAVSSLLLSHFLLKEPFQLGHLVGVVFVLLAISMTALQQERATPSKTTVDLTR